MWWSSKGDRRRSEQYYHQFHYYYHYKMFVNEKQPLANEMPMQSRINQGATIGQRNANAIKHQSRSNHWPTKCQCNQAAMIARWSKSKQQWSRDDQGASSKSNHWSVQCHHTANGMLFDYQLFDDFAEIYWGIILLFLNIKEIKYLICNQVFKTSCFSAESNSIYFFYFFLFFYFFFFNFF